MSNSQLQIGRGVFFVTIIVILALGLSSCISFAPSQATPDQLLNASEPKIVIERFFLYYIRGVWRSMRGRWTDAANDFRLSMRKDKHGSDQERRWIITYGMHTLYDFFPNRELGICNYQLKDYAVASQYLKKSLSQEPTERARHYLKLTNREIILERIKLRSETPAPVHIKVKGFHVIDQILPIRDITYLKHSKFKLVGQVESRHGIRSITINDERIYIPQPDDGELRTKFNLNEPLELPTGKHEIIVKVTNQADLTAEQRMCVIIDLEYPVVRFLPAAVAGKYSSDGNEKLQLKVGDEMGLKSITINGTVASIKPGDITYTQTLPLTEQEVTLEASDQAGNVTRLTLPTSELLELSSLHRQHNPFLLYASSDRVKIKRARPDTTLPVLRLYPPIPRRHKINGVNFVLDFEAIDPGGLRQINVRLNDETKKLYFNSNPVLHVRKPESFNLLEGENYLRMTIWDHRNNQRQHDYTIVSQPAADTRTDIRPGINIIPPNLNLIRANDQECPANDRRMPENFNVFGWFTHGIINQFPPRLLVLNREPQALKAIREEQWYGKFAKQYERLSLNRKQDVDWIFTGYYTPWSGKDNWDLTIEVTDRRSNEIVMIQNMHFTGYDPQEIKTRMRWLGQKFRQSLPIHKRNILSRRGRNIKIGLGEDNGLRKGMHFAFLPHGDSFGDAKRTNKEELVIAVVTDVQNAFSHAEIYPGNARSNVNAQDIAIVR